MKLNTRKTNLVRYMKSLTTILVDVQLYKQNRVTNINTNKIVLNDLSLFIV